MMIDFLAVFFFVLFVFPKRNEIFLIKLSVFCNLKSSHYISLTFISHSLNDSARIRRKISIKSKINYQTETIDSSRYRKCCETHATAYTNNKHEKSKIYNWIFSVNTKNKLDSNSIYHRRFCYVESNDPMACCICSTIVDLWYDEIKFHVNLASRMR